MLDFPVDHVGIAVRSIKDALPAYERLAGNATRRLVEVPPLDLNICFVGSFELLEPRSDDGTLAAWLRDHGPGVHHIAYRVEDLDETMDALRGRGMTWVDAVPRMGAQGHRIAFLHPSSTGGILIELVERKSAGEA